MECTTCADLLIVSKLAIKLYLNADPVLRLPRHRREGVWFQEGGYETIQHLTKHPRPHHLNCQPAFCLEISRSAL